MPVINMPPPEMQIDFSFALGQVRSRYLQDALSATVDSLEIKQIDKELSEFVPGAGLKVLARHGLRGELLYAVPLVLGTNPYLLGYYRLLLGFSQKEFYTKSFGVAGFKSMETKGVISTNRRPILPDLCKGLNRCAHMLAEGIGADRLSKQILDDLTLLTVGPQLRGGTNVRKGIAGIVEVFQTIHRIVEHAAVCSSQDRIEIQNAAGRKVLIEFAADPDIVIKEEMSADRIRNVIAIEVKGGTDFSNIHNRVGEAEKSHQKAKSEGFVECWTVVNVDRIDLEMARRESPTTNMFYRLSDLKSKTGEHYQDFRERIISLTGIRIR